jgi:putative lipoic acid-binding regulatory protein
LSEAAGSEEDRAARQRAIELLEANHEFPGNFSLSVIARNDDAVEAAVVAAAGPGLSSDTHERKPSAGGKYVSHRLVVVVPSADAVLDLFARLRAVEGVITVL